MQLREEASQAKSANERLQAEMNNMAKVLDNIGQAQGQQIKELFNENEQLKKEMNFKQQSALNDGTHSTPIQELEQSALDNEMNSPEQDQHAILNNGALLQLTAIQETEQETESLQREEATDQKNISTNNTAGWEFGAAGTHQQDAASNEATNPTKISPSDAVGWQFEGVCTNQQEATIIETVNGSNSVGASAYLVGDNESATNQENVEPDNKDGSIDKPTCAMVNQKKRTVKKKRRKIVSAGSKGVQTKEKKRKSDPACPVDQPIKKYRQSARIDSRKNNQKKKVHVATDESASIELETVLEKVSFSKSKQD